MHTGSGQPKQPSYSKISIHVSFNPLPIKEEFVDTFLDTAGLFQCQISTSKYYLHND